jgi:hypothetical protein
MAMSLMPAAQRASARPTYLELAGRLELRVVPFRDEDRLRWDAFVEESHNGTMLHTRRFLAYHGNRFADLSLIVEGLDGEIVGLFPAAENPHQPQQAVSHPGATFGGLVRGRFLRGERLSAALALILEHLGERGFSELIYKSAPHPFHRIACEDHFLALHRLGGVLARVDIASVLDLAAERPRPKGRRHAEKRAIQSGIEIAEGFEYLEPFWRVLTEHLDGKFGASPTHTIEEISDLCQRLPEEIICLVGRLDGEVLGGILLFDMGQAFVTQYMASSAAGRTHAVMDLLIQTAIKRGLAAGKRHLSFGTSMAEDGRLNESLYHFKSLFGAGDVAHCSFSLTL